ncbi:MAG: hypothetical protein JWN10_1645, partial [Solirubrobacterales bacterium]|nr:hypothetical protein [Solirubrobacterales bacterium]
MAETRVRIPVAVLNNAPLLRGVLPTRGHECQKYSASRRLLFLLGREQFGEDDAGRRFALRHLSNYCALHGELTEKGGVTEAARYRDVAERALARSLKSLGLDPESRSKLGLRLAQTAGAFDLARHWPYGGSRFRARARQLERNSIARAPRGRIAWSACAPTRPRVSPRRGTQRATTFPVKYGADACKSQLLGDPDAG